MLDIKTLSPEALKNLDREVAKMDGVGIDSEDTFDYLHGLGQFNYCAAWDVGGPLLERMIQAAAARGGFGLRAAPGGGYAFQIDQNGPSCVSNSILVAMVCCMIMQRDYDAMNSVTAFPLVAPLPLMIQ